MDKNNAFMFFVAALRLGNGIYFQFFFLRWVSPVLPIFSSLLPLLKILCHLFYAKSFSNADILVKGRKKKMELFTADVILPLQLIQNVNTYQTISTNLYDMIIWSSPFTQGWIIWHYSYTEFH